MRSDERDGDSRRPTDGSRLPLRPRHRHRPETGSPNRTGKLLRVPLVQFLALGAVLFGLNRALEEPPGTSSRAATEPQEIILTRDEATRLIHAWETRNGRAADAAVQTALIEAAIEEEMLAHEARRRSLDRNDPAVNARLVEQMRFLDNAPALNPKSPADRATSDAAATAELLERARALGLARSDPLIRRILAGRMRAVLAPPSSADDGDDAARRAWFTAHASRFAAPERVDLQQLLLPADPAASTLLERLRSGALSVADARPLARPLPLPGELHQASAARLATIFGPAFADAVMRLEPGSWQGPVVSAHGSHLVRVQAKFPATRPTFEEIEPRARLALRTERHDARLRSAIAGLRASYKIHRPATQAMPAQPVRSGLEQADR